MIVHQLKQSGSSGADSFVNAGYAEGLQAWRAKWIPVLLEALTSPEAHVRHRVSLYAVPVPLGLDAASALPLLQQVLQPHQTGQSAAADGQVCVSHALTLLTTGRARSV